MNPITKMFKERREKFDKNFTPPIYCSFIDLDGLKKQGNIDQTNRLKFFQKSNILEVLDVYEKWGREKIGFFEEASGGTMESSLYAKGVATAIKDLLTFTKEAREEIEKEV